MTRGAMMMISAATAGILMAGTAAAISVVNATETAPTSTTIDLIAEQVTIPVPTPTPTAPATAGSSDRYVAPAAEPAAKSSSQSVARVPSPARHSNVSSSPSQLPTLQPTSGEHEVEHSDDRDGDDD
ncbi:MAG: hypothetical protein Q7L55_13190 [Actinomycetota bacterium]|nr:hypothetical protein [Actinomycetota bacterium]